MSRIRRHPRIAIAVVAAAAFTLLPMSAATAQSSGKHCYVTVAPATATSAAHPNLLATIHCWE